MTAILFLSFKSFSQNVILSEKTAKLVAKDLSEGDYCRQEKENLEKKIKEKDNIIENKIQDVENLESQNEVLNSIVLIKNETIENKNKSISDQEKIINRNKNTSIVWKCGTAIAIVLGIILAVQ